MQRHRYRPHILATLSLGLPLIGSHLARMAIGVGDTVMIGWYGVEPLAALVIATSFFHILFFLGMGFGTGLMGLCMMVTGAVSGHLQEWMGYVHYFWFVMAATIPSFLVTWFAPFHHKEG